MIYFDNAATTPVADEVREVVNEVLRDVWGNPSSLHRLGLVAEKRLEESRATIARILSVKPKTITFTSCATESLNAALFGALEGNEGNLVISAVEHSAVHAPAMRERERGRDVRVVPVDGFGRVSVEDVLERVDKNTALVCVMHVNNELGTIQPVEDIARAVKEKNPRTLVLVDGVQAFGKIPVSLRSFPVDFYASSGHKIHAPKGVGFLYIREGLSVPAQLLGGGQEAGVRPGTENVAYAAAFAKAAELQCAADPEAVRAVREAAWKNLSTLEGVRRNSPEDGSPYILNVGVTGIKSEILLHMMEQNNMYLSSGSACSGKKASRVIQAAGVPAEYADGCMRLSFSRFSTVDDARRFTEQMKASISAIRQIIGNQNRR